VPIIGQGGITTCSDALEFIIAGSATIGVGTALFYDPLVCTSINAGVADYLDTRGYDRIDQLVGSLELGEDTEDSALSG
jgi:dihydroorotate dehydrogenase (NAD+) catalytic subunit